MQMIDLNKNQLKQLRREIVLNSIFTNDYKNSFDLDPEQVQTFFDSFIDDIENTTKENPKSKDYKLYKKDFHKWLAKHDNINELYNYFLSVAWDI